MDCLPPLLNFSHWRRWLQSGQLVHAPAWALEASNNLGVAVFMDFFSTHNTATLVQQLLFGGPGNTWPVSVCFIRTTIVGQDHVPADPVRLTGQHSVWIKFSCALVAANS